MSTPDLDSLLAGVGRGRNLPPEVREARRLEQTTRASRAQSIARVALTKLHPTDYRSLYEQALEKVNAERGPLPGDDLSGADDD